MNPEAKGARKDAAKFLLRKLFIRHYQKVYQGHKKLQPDVKDKVKSAVALFKGGHYYQAYHHIREVKIE